MATVSLQKIIDGLLDNDPNVSDSLESDKRTLYRKFNKLIEKLGANKEIIKNRNHYEFSETQVPFIRVLLLQLHTGKGIVAEFVNKKTRNKRFSSTEVQELIQSLLDEADRQGASEDELKEMMQFFSLIFRLSPLRSIEYCHACIDALAANLSDLPYTGQAEYLLHLEDILTHEFVLRSIEAAANSLTIAECLAEVSDPNGPSPYNEHSSEIEFEYTQRDRAVLELIQEDEDLRIYIEKKLQKPVEEIFAHVVSE